MANWLVGHRHMDKTGGIGMGNVIELVAREKTYSGREAAAPLVPRSPAPFERLEEQIHMLARHVQRQEDAQMALLERLEKQEAYIRSSLKERDRRLTKAMRDILETKAQIARMQDEKRKTTIWHKLFRIT